MISRERSAPSPGQLSRAGGRRLADARRCSRWQEYWGGVVLGRGDYWGYDYWRVGLLGRVITGEGTTGDRITGEQDYWGGWLLGRVLLKQVWVCRAKIGLLHSWRCKRCSWTWMWCSRPDPLPCIIGLSLRQVVYWPLTCQKTNRIT